MQQKEQIETERERQKQQQPIWWIPQSAQRISREGLPAERSRIPKWQLAMDEQTLTQKLRMWPMREGNVRKFGLGRERNARQSNNHFTGECDDSAK